MSKSSFWLRLRGLRQHLNVVPSSSCKRIKWNNLATSGWNTRGIMATSISISSDNSNDRDSNATLTPSRRRSYHPIMTHHYVHSHCSTFNQATSHTSTIQHISIQSKCHTTSTTTSKNRSFIINNTLKQQTPTFISILSKDAATAPIDYPTSQLFWAALPPAIAIHLSIGSVYAYSMWTSGMSKTLGVIAAAPLDWTYPQLLPVFSCSAIVLGMTTSALGAWVEKVGPRMAGMVGSAFWSSALLTTALGVEAHSLPMVYLGYGVLGGVGWGLMYLTPVTSAMKWFPDRRGLATGIALSAFGAGAALAPGVIHTLIDSFAVAPQYIGLYSLPSAAAAEEAVSLLVELTALSDGSQVIATNSPIGEPGTPVVVATKADIAKCSGLAIREPGVYAIGTGDTGVSKAMAPLGALYGVLGAVGSRFMQIPHPDWRPNNSVGDSNVHVRLTNNCHPDKEERDSNDGGLPASYAISTRQFQLLWLSVFGYATGGLALLSSSKLMLTDIFASVAPAIVSPSFSTGYVSALGFGMALGRFGWSAISDILGRQQTYALFGLGIPIIGMAPYLCHTVVDLASNGSGVEIVLPYLMAFYGGSVLSITFYGGIFSVLPAYIADLFGQKHSGAIHGKALTAWAASAVAGPMGLACLRSYSYDNAMQDLLLIVAAHDESALERTFGVSISDEEAMRLLINAKTITIERVLELVPVGTVDPTPFLYDTTCYAAAGLMGVAALSNLAIRPLDLKKENRESIQDVQKSK